MRQQQALTIVTRLNPGSAETKALGGFLEEIGANPQDNPHVPFRDIGTTCFAAWVLLDNDPHYPPTLVFESNYEGKLGDYLKALVSRAAPALHRIYQHCPDYTAAKEDAAYLQEFLKAHIEHHEAFYVGCSYQSQRGILAAIEARAVIEKYLGAHARDGRSPEQLRQDIEKHVAAQIPPLDGLITPLQQVRRRAHLNAALLVMAALAAVAVLYRLFGWTLVFIPIAAAVLAAVIRIKEVRESKVERQGRGKIDPRLFRSEDRFLDNHLTTLVEIRPGRLRFYTLRAVLWLIGLLARFVYITGHLGNIPTIHFARWVIIDRDMPVPRLLFLSNFDGSWHSYLGDFVDRAWFGLNGIWGNTAEFPTTLFLFGKGSRQVVEFKQWSRDHNLFAHVWYSAYEMSVKNILNNIGIAEKIGKKLDREETITWLRSL